MEKTHFTTGEKVKLFFMHFGLALGVLVVPLPGLLGAPCIVQGGRVAFLAGSFPEAFYT